MYKALEKLRQIDPEGAQDIQNYIEYLENKVESLQLDIELGEDGF